MKILVTGGLGFIGSHTVVELQNEGFEVVVVDNLSNSSKDVLQGVEAITGKRPIFEEFDLRDKYEFYNDEKTNHTNLKTYIPPRDFISDTDLKIFPLSGISKVDTILCNENGYYSVYQSDRYGFNNPDNEFSEK